MVAFLLALALAGEVTDADIEAYAARSQAERSQALIGAKKAMAGLRRQRQMSRESRGQALTAMRAKIAVLESKTAPYYPPMLTLSHRQRSIGTLDEISFQCVQVSGKQDALLSRSTVSGSVGYMYGRIVADSRAEKTKLYWLRGYPTASFTDGEAVALKGVFMVDGTETYNDTNGGTTTVPLIRVVEIHKYADKFKPSASSTNQPASPPRR